MRRGPYLHPSSFIEGALRMASEDPKSTSWRLVLHRYADACHHGSWALAKRGCP
jgi:hypothetical protein